MQSIKSVGVSQVLHIIKCRVDFELGVPIKEAPSISEAHIKDRRKRCYRWKGYKGEERL